MTQNPQTKHIVIDARIRRSGTGRYVDRLVEHLQAVDTDQHHYSVLVQPSDDWQPSSDNFKRINCDIPQFSLNLLDQIRFTLELYKLKPDLVHFPMNQQPLLFFKPVVTSTLDLTMLRFTRAGKTPVPIFKLKMLAYRFLFWYSNKKSRHIITLTKFVQKDLAKHYPFTANKTTTTYCASEPPLPVKAKLPSFIDPKTPFLLYVGTAFPHKNLETLAKAFLVLSKQMPAIKLILVGQKEQYYEALEVKLSKIPEAKKSILITGFVPDEELKWLYENTAAYVFPSLSEGFGLPGLEAMIHGAPVVSSNATCLPEVYKDAAEYFDPKNVEEMADAIQKVLSDDKLRKRLIKRGNVVANSYSWRRMAEQTLDVYKEVLDKN